jgi:FkbM family methyltransferase
VWDVPGEIEFEIPTVDAHGVEGHLLSRISNLERNENYFKAHFAQNTTRVTVPSNTITNILQEHHTIPCVIDYLSIDTEGAEFEALKSIDFNKIDIRFMTIEHGDRPGYIEQFAEYLTPYGYKIHRINHWDVEFEK